MLCSRKWTEICGIGVDTSLRESQALALTYGKLSAGLTDNTFFSEGIKPRPKVSTSMNN